MREQSSKILPLGIALALLAFTQACAKGEGETAGNSPFAAPHSTEGGTPTDLLLSPPSRSPGAPPTPDATPAEQKAPKHARATLAASARTVEAPAYEFDPPAIISDAYAPEGPIEAYDKPFYLAGKKALYGVALFQDTSVREDFDPSSKVIGSILRGEKVSILESIGWTWAWGRYRSAYRIRTAAGLAGWAPCASIAAVMAEDDSCWYGVQEQASCYVIGGDIHLFPFERLVGGSIGGGCEDRFLDFTYRLDEVLWLEIRKLSLSDIDGDGVAELQARLDNRSFRIGSESFSYVYELWSQGVPDKETEIFNTSEFQAMDASSVSIEDVAMTAGGIEGDPAVRVKFDVSTKDHDYKFTSYFRARTYYYHLDETIPKLAYIAAADGARFYTTPDPEGTPIECERPKVLYVTEIGGPDRSWYFAVGDNGVRGWVQKVGLRDYEPEDSRPFPYNVDMFLRQYARKEGD